MIKLLKNAEVYAPAYLGKKDVLVVGTKIARIDDEITGYEGLPEVEVFDFTGKKIVPGYIDMHVHVTGGGGEQGPASRVPESQLSFFLKNGVTTCLGLLGTDGITKSIENLLAKARALTEEGITVYTITGSYGYPSNTLTGSVERDIVLLTPMIGVKVAVSDHRSSNPQGEDIIALGTSCRRAGLISNTPGIVIMHMGDGAGSLNPVFYALDNSDVPAKHFLPTHILRKASLIDDAAKLVQRGGFIDCTVGSNEKELYDYADKLYELINREGVDIEHVTLSTDSFGSMPRFNEKGDCIGLTYATPANLHRTIKLLVEKGMALEKVLKMVTTNSAYLLGQVGVKGAVAVNADADVLVLDKDLNINSLFAKGKTALLEGELLMKGRFEI